MLLGSPAQGATPRRCRGLLLARPGLGTAEHENDFSPKRDQGLETPWSFAFGGACLLKDRLAQACGQMIMEKLNRAQQLDPLLRGN